MRHIDAIPQGDDSLPEFCTETVQQGAAADSEVSEAAFIIIIGSKMGTLIFA